MHEFLDKLSVQDLAKLMFDTEHGLGVIRDSLHNTEIGDYYDKFIEETCEIMCYLFTHFRKDDE